MNRRHLLTVTGLVLTVLAVPRGGPPAFAAAREPEPDDCEIEATTGRSVARRRCDGTKTEARVDNRITSHDMRAAPRTRERPIDRLRSRGQGRIKATGDKGAKLELRAKQRRGS